MSERVSEVFVEIMSMAERLGVSHINQLPGCWEHAVSEGWWIAINGHDAEIACSHGPKVPPFHVYVEWNGFPAGIISPAGGILAAGSEANEATLIAALRVSS